MKRKNNVLFISCDQLRQDALGTYGNNVVKTPNIDRLFKNGIKFSNMFAVNPVCAPNRGAIATGRWPKVNGLASNACVLPENAITMMEVFRQNSYTTYGVGKMHFAPQWLKDWNDNGKGAVDPQPEPWRRPWHGFDHCMITEDNRIGPYAEFLKSKGYDVWDDLHSFSMGKQHYTQKSPYPEEFHQTTWITDRSLDYLKTHDYSKPFFMWTSYVHPHHPFNPPAPFDKMYDPEEMPLPIYKEGEHELRSEFFAAQVYGKNLGHCAFDGDEMSDRNWQEIKAYYYGMISLIDKNIGRMIEYLKETGEYENTIFVLTSDHGEMLGDHHIMFKDTAFDCVTKMPFILNIPGISNGKEIDILCRSIEIMPSILDLTGLIKPEFLNGISLADHILGNKAGELFDDIIIEQYFCHTIRNGKYRMTIYHEYPHGELYDLENDPENFRNLWYEPSYGKIKEGLTSKLIGKIHRDISEPRFRKKGMC